MVFRLLLVALCFSNYTAFAALPQDSAQSVSSKNQDESISYASLTDWSSACLSSYDEQKAPKPSSHPRSVLSFEEFVRVFNEYKENMQEKGILNEATWNAIDQKTAVLSNDIKHPHATVLRIGDESKVCFIGDLHGSLHSLLRSLWRLVALGYLDDQFKIIKKDFYMVFTGDYVDRGRFSIEVLYTLLRLKCVNWEQVYLIRGNHEKVNVNKEEDFTNPYMERYLQNIELEFYKKYNQYNPNNPKKLSDFFTLLYQLYDTMPLAVYIVVNDEVIKAVHGGFAPYDYYDVNHLKNNKEVPESLLSIRYIYIPLGSQGNFNEDNRPDNDYSGYQWCDFDQYKKPKSSKNLEFFKDSFSQDFIRKAGGRIWCVGRSASQLLLEKAGIRLMMRGHQHFSFGLKVLGIAENSDAFKPAGSDYSSGNPSLYNWVAALSHIGAIDEHNESDGFLVSKMIPIFTFSSAIEGVGVKSDCFGILSIKGPFEEWRLKVYEFPVWFASINPSISKLTNPFTLIKPINKTIQDKTYKSTSGMEDSIFVEFSEEHGDQATIKGWLQEIVNASAGNGQSASKNVTE